MTTKSDNSITAPTDAVVGTSRSFTAPGWWPIHPNEGRTLYPYAIDLPLHVVRRDWFEAYEALIMYEPDFAHAPGLRFVRNDATPPVRLRVTAPLLDRELAARGRWWKPLVEGDDKIGVWVRCSRSISSRPRHPPDRSVIVIDAR